MNNILARKNYEGAKLFAYKDVLIKHIHISDDCGSFVITTDIGENKILLSETNTPLLDNNILNIEVEEGSKYLTCKIDCIDENLKYEINAHLNNLLKKKWVLKQERIHISSIQPETASNTKTKQWGYSMAYMVGNNISWSDITDEIPYAIQRQDERNLYKMACALECHKRYMGYDMRRMFDGTLNFKIKQPEIEICEIIDFLKIIDNKRVKDYTHVIYINLCMNSKWYVGISPVKTSQEDKYKAAAISRLNKHRINGGGSYPTNWTWINPVISTIMFLKGDYVDENLITLLLAKCVGNDNVRGGAWTGIHETPVFPIMSVNEIQDAILNNS